MDPALGLLAIPSRTGIDTRDLLYSGCYGLRVITEVSLLT